MNDGTHSALWWLGILVVVALFWPPMWVVIGLIVVLGGMVGLCIAISIACDEKPDGNK